MNLWYTCWLHWRDPHSLWNWGPTCRFVALPRGLWSPRSNECIKRIHNCSSLMCDRYNIPHFTPLFQDSMCEWAQWNRNKKGQKKKPYINWAGTAAFYGLCFPLWRGTGPIEWWPLGVSCQNANLKLPFHLPEDSVTRHRNLSPSLRPLSPIHHASSRGTTK